MVQVVALFGLCVGWFSPRCAWAQGVCCNSISFNDPDWCHAGNCLGEGCQLDNPNTQEDESLRQCSDISQCFCGGIVTWTTKSFCTVLKSCDNAQLDFEQARTRIREKTTANPSEECVNALARVVCAYHFPYCINDVQSYDQVCFDSCNAVNQSCGLLLSDFAAVGSRCNLLLVDQTNPAQILRGNERCTASAHTLQPPSLLVLLAVATVSSAWHAGAALLPVRRTDMAHAWLDVG